MGFAKDYYTIVFCVLDYYNIYRRLHSYILFVCKDQFGDRK